MRFLTFCLVLMINEGHCLGLMPGKASAHESSNGVLALPRNWSQDVYDEKSRRTPAQKKIDSQLLYALKQKRGDTRGVPTERISFEADAKGRVVVDITAIVGPAVTSRIRKLGGIVISEDERYHTIRARLALEKLEALAALKDVRFIAPPAQALFNRSVPD